MKRILTETVLHVRDWFLALVIWIGSAIIMDECGWHWFSKAMDSTAPIAYVGAGPIAWWTIYVVLPVTLIWAAFWAFRIK